MIGNLKTLGLALMAISVVSATVASSALAVEEQGELTSDGPVKLVGTDNTLVAPSAFTYGGQRILCHNNYQASAENVTPHTFVTLPRTTLTMTIVSANCIMVVGALQATATITMNGCDYLLHIGTTTGTPGQYAVTTDIVCPAGEVIETHLYSNETDTAGFCTFTFPAQTGRTGAFVQNEAGGVIKLGGTVKGVVATIQKTIFCGHGESKNTEFHFNAIFSGTNEGGAPTAIELTEKGI